MRQALPRERGFALLVVLWTMVLLVLLTARLMAGGRGEVQLAHNSRINAAADAMAEGAVYETIFRLLDGGARHWPRSGQFALAPAGGHVDIRIVDLSSRVNPNTASAELMARLLEGLGVGPPQAAAIAAAIVDWRTPGHRPSEHGAKLTQYQAAGRAYGPPNQEIEDLAELGFILGMTPDIDARLRPHLSIYPDNDPDPTLADPAIIRAMLQTGADVTLGAAATDSAVVSVTATAHEAGGGVSSRQAVVRLAPGARQRGWRILAWQPPD